MDRPRDVISTYINVESTLSVCWVKDFKYQITLKLLLRKYKKNTGREFAPVYINSTAEKVIVPKYGLTKSFQKVFNRIDNWINERPGWITESIDSEYVNIYIYSTLSGSSCIELSDKLKFKTYADFEFVLKEVQINDNDNNAPCTEKYQKHIPCLQSCMY